MPRPPSVIFIARHGARLDAEDKTWTDRASAPYDTPLSYGGWTQTRALGAKIAALLHAEDELHTRLAEENANDAADDNNTRRQSRNPRSHKKRKIVIHTSPFLRCVQSAVAVASGVAQFNGNLAKFRANEARFNTSTRLQRPPPRSLTLDPAAINKNYLSPTQSASTPDRPTSPQPRTFDRPNLRVDAFLGEWLSPQYYEHIQAPPPSDIMVAGAKAELMRTADPIQGSVPLHGDDRLKTSAPTEVGIGAGARSSDEGLDNMNTLTSSLPSRITFSADTKLGTGSRYSRPAGKITGYTPPQPQYALRSIDPIPVGYFAEARDACVKFDSDWDSASEPQNWGDGGVHVEEWSSMHIRFRRGLAGMVSWYSEHGSSETNVNVSPGGDEERDDDEDIALVLITHSAGCNALIGALTNQPVLIDVGMGSLTMAARKAGASAASTSPDASRSLLARRRRSSMDVGLANVYEMKMLASTEHLRTGANPLQIPQLQMPWSLASISEQGLRRADGSVSPSDRDRSQTRNSALGSVRRRPSVPINTYSSRLSAPSTSSGLWRSRDSSAEERQQDEERQPTPPPLKGVRFDVEAPRPKTADEPRSPKALDSPEQPPAPGPPSRSGSGLWSANGGPARGPGARRRAWTITEAQ